MKIVLDTSLVVQYAHIELHSAVILVISAGVKVFGQVCSNLEVIEH